MKKLSKIKLSEFTGLNSNELLHIRGGFSETTGNFDEDDFTGDFTGDFSDSCESYMCMKKACKTESNGTCISKMCNKKSCKRNE